jgi:predicted DNA-binding protein YlxM (UPF0122 family)
VDNLSYREVGERLDLSIETVRDHIKNIYRKLRLNSKMEVVQKKIKGSGFSGQDSAFRDQASVNTQVT